MIGFNFAELSDGTQLAIVAGVFGVFTLLLEMWKTKQATDREDRLAARTDAVALEAKSAAEKVATVLTETKSSTDKKLDGIHRLVNKAFGDLLKRVMLMSRDKADKSQDAGNIAEANADQLAYENHMRDQPGAGQ